MSKLGPGNIQTGYGTIGIAICLNYRNKHCRSSLHSAWGKTHIKDANMGYK